MTSPDVRFDLEEGVRDGEGPCACASELVPEEYFPRSGGVENGDSGWRGDLAVAQNERAGSSYRGGLAAQQRATFVP